MADADSREAGANGPVALKDLNGVAIALVDDSFALTFVAAAHDLEQEKHGIGE